MTVFVVATLRKLWRLRWLHRWGLALEVVSTTSMLLVFFFIDRFQHAIGGAALREGLAGLNTSYFGYVALGLAVSELSTSALGGVLGQFQVDKRSGVFEVLVCSPIGIHRWAVAAGIANLFHAFFRFCLIFGIAVGILGLTVPAFSVGLALMLLLLAIPSLWAFSVLSLCSVLLLRRGNVFGFVTSIAYEILSGVYVPLSVLPEEVRPISEVIPITPTLRALQKVVYDQGSLGDVKRDLFLILIHAAVYVPLAWFVLKGTDWWAKKKGHYVLE